MNKSQLKSYLDQLVIRFEQPAFIESDPISVPHLYTKNQDIEIAGLFASVFAWGQRITIINKSKELMHRMDNAPYEFILRHTESDLLKLNSFVHRTFQSDDLLYFIAFLQYHYSAHPSLESAFVLNGKFGSVEESLNYFNSYFFSLPFAPLRTKKHISQPISGSTCKRLCMYLRWMVRSAKNGVDFGIWNNIPVKDLKIPLDVHVHRVAVSLGLLTGDQKNWKTVLELTDQLKNFDPLDPVKYDFALFNLGVNKQPL